MFSDLVTFTTPAMQRAAMMVALLQLVLKKSGNVDDALRLEGLDVTDTSMAQVAIEILSAMKLQDHDASVTRMLALGSLREAVCSAVIQHAN